LLGVSRQVYYRKLRSTNKRKQTAQTVIKMVNELRFRMPKIGTRKLYFLLGHQLKEMNVGRDMLFRILKANHMLIKAKRHYHITTNSHHRFRKHKNLIEGLVPTQPEQIWVSDITYIGNRNNPMYLALVTDAYSKKIVGYDVSNSLDVRGSTRALKKAIKSRVYKSNQIIHHSDRGLQYCSNEYQSILMKNKIKCSMTGSYDPYANAVAERINGIIKAEFIGENNVCDLTLMQELVNDSVKTYNELRPHYSCYFNTPNQMHKQRKLNIRSYKRKNTNDDIIVGVN
jgi:transposase InsO family protein